MNIKIMCDASFDLNYGLSGYAGMVTVNSEYFPYCGSFAGLKSSNEAELNAIYEGLKVTIANSPKENPVTSVSIFSDSQNSIDRLKNKNKDLKKSRLEYFLLKKITAIYEEHNIKPYYHHVKAHQSNRTATVLEKRHNAIDKQAYRMLKERRKTFDFANKRNKQSATYGIIVDSNPNKRMAIAYKKLGYELASSGMNARVLMQGDKVNVTNHPFFEGIQEYAIKAGKNTSNLITQVHWTDKVVSGFTDRMFGCQGMDSCLFRDHKVKNHLKVSDKFSEANRAGATSRLLFGYQARIKNSEVANANYNTEPSRFILDLSMSKKENMSATYWAKTFCKKLGIKLFNNLKELQNDKEINLLNNGLPENLKDNNYSMAV